jgi:ribosomal protein S18 acetylase RimI-like enzyme
VRTKEAQVRVRRATASDAPALADLATRTFVTAFAADNDPRDIQRYVAESFSRERIGVELAAWGSTFLLGYDDTRSAPGAVGYARLQRGTNTHVDGQRPTQLVRLYVEPALIGQRYGGALLQACLDEATRLGCDTMWLGVWEHNTQARRFYERWGFLHVGEQAFALGSDVQTDHVLARALP